MRLKPCELLKLLTNFVNLPNSAWKRQNTCLIIAIMLNDWLDLLKCLWFMFIWIWFAYGIKEGYGDGIERGRGVCVSLSAGEIMVYTTPFAYSPNFGEFGYLANSAEFWLLCDSWIIFNSDTGVLFLSKLHPFKLLLAHFLIVGRLVCEILDAEVAEV